MTRETDESLLAVIDRLEQRIWGISTREREARREQARKEIRLADIPQALFPDLELVWETKVIVPDKFMVARGYKPGEDDSLGRICSAEAYYCGGPHKLGCNGWIKGTPEEKPYDDETPLAGSAGTLIKCHVCKTELFRHPTIRFVR